MITMSPDEDYREYLQRVWVSAKVADVQKNRSTRWRRIKRWIERKVGR